MKKKITLFCLISFFCFREMNSQVVIASDDFENSLTLFSATGSPSFFSGISGAGNDRPASSPFSFSNTYACGSLNGIVTLTSNPIDVSTFSSINLSLKLAAFSIGDINNGLDNADFVEIEISPDGGLNYYRTVRVRGFSNSYWSYTGGTAIATTSYDGDLNVVAFGPSGLGERTGDGYSTMNITNLPQVNNLQIRITLLNNFPPELWLIDKFEITGIPVTGPLINIYPFSLSGFSSITGNPSAEKNYTIRGLNLTNNIIINAPDGFEISQTSGSGFGSALTLTPSGGAVPWTTIYIRMNSAILGPNSGTITHTSPGATNKNIIVSGNVFSVEPTISSTVSFTNITGESMTINFNGGNGFGHLVVMRLSTAITAVPVDGNNYTASNVFGGASVIGSGQYVVYNGTGNSVNVLGLNPVSTYYVSVFEFNDGGVIAARNYFANPGTGNAATTVLNEGLELTSPNSLFTIDFDNTVPRVNNGSFAGVTLTTSPLSGEINSKAICIDGAIFSGAAVFGRSESTGGGISSGNVTVPAYYAFQPVSGNTALGIQPDNTYFNGGSITLRVQNNTGFTLDSLAIAYNLYVLNNGNIANHINFMISTDNINYGTRNSDTTIEIAEVTPQWKGYLRSTIFRNLSLANGAYVYFRWTGGSISGTGSFDEFAIDDIKMVGNPVTVYPRIAGNYENIIAKGRLQLSANTTTIGDITLSEHIELGNFSLTAGGSINRSPYGYIVTNGSGTLTINAISSSRLFPIGITTYNPVTIANGSGLNWSVGLTNGVTNPQAPLNSNNAVQRTWTVTPSINPPPAGANIIFGYNDGDPTQIGAGFNSSADVQVWHYNGTNWGTASALLTPTGSPGNDRTVTLTNWLQYSPFVVANSPGALPVNFGPVQAVKTGGGIRITWTNYSENDISFYYVEKSFDGLQFSPVLHQNAIRNDGNQATYSSFDSSINQSNIIYYRIKAVETNGKIIYSVTIKIKLQNLNPQISVFPNPANNQAINFILSDLPKDVYILKIFSLSGQAVYNQFINHQGGTVSFTVKNSLLIKPGVYLANLLGPKQTLLIKFIIQ